eukprot:4307217-Alexandrium_andersonii.AAC.1
MSASLVGSEMCIRDSMLPAAPQLPSPHTPLPHRRHLRCRCRLPAALWACLLYTSDAADDM